MVKYIIMLAIALGVYFAAKMVLRSARRGGCVGCSEGCSCSGSCGSSNCSCNSDKQINK